MLRHREKTRLSGLNLLLCVLLCLVVSSAAVLNTVSIAVEAQSPELALRLNPLNPDHRLDLAYSLLNESEADPDPETVAMIETGIRISPLDGRFYSLLGLVHQQQDDDEGANRLYDRALSLLPTEVLALSNKMGYSFEAGDYRAALDYLEIIGRRWGYWPSVEVVFPVLMADDDAFAHLSERYAKDSTLRNLIVGTLSRSEEGLPFVAPLLLEWNRRGIAGLDPLLASATTALIGAARFDEAYQLFRQTIASGESELVFNGDFRRPFSGNPFDWKIRSQAGVDFQRGPEGGLTIRFLDTPVRLQNVTQLLRLEPGSYRLAVSFFAGNLQAPAPVKIGIGCNGERRLLGEIALSGDTAAIEFSVPQADCPVQRLGIFNDNLPESWKYRYSGTLRIEDVRITPVQG